VISQNDWPVAFYSRKLNAAQNNYTTIEKELLSIVETVQHFRHILLGHSCRFYSNNQNLGFDNLKSERVRCWRLTLEEFEYKFIYHPVKQNRIVNMLSCYPMVSVTTPAFKEVTTLNNADFPASITNIYNLQKHLNVLASSFSHQDLRDPNFQDSIIKILFLGKCFKLVLMEIHGLESMTTSQ
jgi:hypothetical protein